MVRPKLAAVVTVYRKYSHAQHIVDRFLDGYGWNGTYHHPEMDLVSLYVDQVGDDDLSREREKRFPSMKIYPTIQESLTLGTSKLAVDGVVLVKSADVGEVLAPGTAVVTVGDIDHPWLRGYINETDLGNAWSHGFFANTPDGQNGQLS